MGRGGEARQKFTMVSQKPYNENEFVKLGTYNSETVKEYTYLGTVLTNKNESRPESEKRITNANTAILDSQSIQSRKNKNP